MTRKDYKLIAEAINQALQTWNMTTSGKLSTQDVHTLTGARMAIRDVIDNISNALKQENALFDYDKFDIACNKNIQ